MEKTENFGLGWSLVPPAILSTNELSANEKLLWGRINGLTNKRGFCFATNGWLSSQLGLSDRTAEGLINNMIDKGFLKRLFVYKKGEEEIILEKYDKVKGMKLVERRLFPLRSQNPVG